jgi:hypothetical protein
LRRLSPAAKIPFQTRIGQADRNKAGGRQNQAGGAGRFKSAKPDKPAPDSRQ